MSNTATGAAYALPWLALVGGVVALAARRRRAPRAVGFALPLLLVMALFAAMPPVFKLGGGLPRPLFAPALAAYPWVQAGGWALLAASVMVGRRPGGRDVLH